MQTQVWVSVASLVGVGLGGGLTYLTQVTNQRQANRHERVRLDRERDERRREERLELLRSFIEMGQRAERAAEERTVGEEWFRAAKDVMDELWVCERMIRVLFEEGLHRRARAYVKALNDVLWEEPPAGTLWDYLQGPKTEFLGAAHEALR